ncbi:MAG: TolC family protein [Elusimicrobiota bacterium]
MKRITCICFIILSSVFTSKYAIAQDKTGLGILIKIALERNPEIRSAHAKWESKIAGIIPAKTPSDINLGISFENLPDEDKDMRYRGRKVLMLSQKYPFPGKLSLKGKIAESEGNVYKYTYEQDRWKVLTKLKKAYYEYFYLQKSIEIFRQEEEILDYFSKVAEQSYIVGKEKHINVLKAQVELAKVMNKIITLEKTKITVQAEINAILDYPSGKPVGEVEEPEYNGMDFNWGRINMIVRKNNPVLKEKSELETRSYNNLTLAKKEYMPDFGFTFKSREISGDFTGIDMGVNLNLPVYFWKQKGIIKTKDKELESAQAIYKNMLNNIDYKLTSIITMIDMHERLYKLFKTNFIPRAEQARDVAEVGYKAGTVIFLDWLDTQRSYLEFKIEYWEHFKDYLKGLADLEEIAGTDIHNIMKEGR